MIEHVPIILNPGLVREYEDIDGELHEDRIPLDVAMTIGDWDEIPEPPAPDRRHATPLWRSNDLMPEHDLLMAIVNGKRDKARANQPSKRKS